MAFRILDVFFPPLCLSCGKRIENAGKLCSGCFSKLKFVKPPFCGVCGKPLPDGCGSPVCGECLTHSFGFSKARSALCYGEISKDLILALKYGDRTDGVDWMASVMQSAGGDVLNGADVLIPVPLHRYRLLSRKYNQAALLSASLSGLTGVPSNPFVLKRNTATAKQGRFSRAGRFKNVQGAFQVCAGQNIKGKVCVLIDDVMTSGATADACAAALKKAGAGDVRVLTLARAVDHQAVTAQIS